jgi:predicted nucleotide-binding protein
MANINPLLLQALVKRLGISDKAVYRQIQAVAGRTILEKDLAALVRANEVGINIHRYSTPTQREQLRGHLRGGNPDSPVPAAPPPASAPVRASTTRRGKLVRRPKTKDNSVFVVHGRDEALRKSMFEFLRALGLTPMEWSHAIAAAKGANPYIGEILDKAMEKVQAVVVLFSPDEIAHLKEQFWRPGDKQGDGKPSGQARPNVLFEAGLALGAHDKKTVLVQVGKMRHISDLAGKHMAHLGNAVESRNAFANRLAKIGCSINKDGNDWMTAGNLVPTEPKPKKKPKKA